MPPSGSPLRSRRASLCSFWSTRCARRLKGPRIRSACGFSADSASHAEISSLGPLATSQGKSCLQVRNHVEWHRSGMKHADLNLPAWPLPASLAHQCSFRLFHFRSVCMARRLRSLSLTRIMMLGNYSHQHSNRIQCFSCFREKPLHCE